MFSVTFYFDRECGLEHQNSVCIRCLFVKCESFLLTFTMGFYFVKWALDLYGSTLIIPRNKIVAGYYGFTLVVHVSIRPSVFSFPDDNLSNFQWLFIKLGLGMNIMEIWIGLLMNNVGQLFTELSALELKKKHIYILGYEADPWCGV